MSNAVINLFENLTVRDVLEKYGEKTNFSLSANTNVKDAVDFLSSHPEFPAVPVLEENKCLGMAGMIDVAAFVINAVPNPEFLEPGQLRTLKIAGRDVAKEEIRNIVNISQKDPFIPMNLDSKVTELARVFAEGVHCVPVLDKENNIQGLVSQFNLINLLKNKLTTEDTREAGEKRKEETTVGTKNLQSFMGKNITAFHLGRASPITISGKTAVIHAINLLWKHKVSSLAVIEPNGRLCGNFSAHDLRGLMLENWSDLLLPLSDYLQKYSETSLAPICAKNDTTLGETLNEMVESKIHRLWCIDSDFKPTGVISITDLMKCFLEASA